MNYLGLNKGWTCSGKMLRGGGAAAFLDGNLMAISEERITGQKHAPGYSQALQALLQHKSLTLDDFDSIGISTCCEPEFLALEAHDLANHPRIESVNHHLSHASLAFYASGFERALVIVVDGGGNVFESTHGGLQANDWWTKPREQHSYYLATRDRGLELICRDFGEPFAVGMGEMYRAFTYYLGWPSSTNSSKTMALAGHGRRRAIRADLFTMENGNLTTHIRNNPFHPIDMVAELAHVMDVDFGEPRSPRGAILQIHKDVAAFVQDQCEHWLSLRLDYLRRKFSVDNLCISGGFALNVVANGTFLKTFRAGTFVPSAPGDEGQCLGNVFALLSRRMRKERIMPTITKSSDAFLGPASPVDSKSVAYGLADVGHKSYVVFETSDFSDLIARMLASGSAVCLYQGRAEFGPRALGSRSILADPRRPDAVSRLNALKDREWFMPFAPTVLRESMAEWFMPAADSPFMSFAVDATARAVHELPAIVNADHSARVQTVGPKDDTPLRRILTRFAEHTQIPVLLNTSFNRGGDPIVETIQQALECFSSIPVNALGIGRFVVVKSLSPDVGDLPISATISDLDVEVYAEADGAPVVVAQTRPRLRIRQIQALTDSVVFVRTELPLYGEFLAWLREGRKVTTIRLRKGAVEVPSNSVLPLFETADFGPGDRSHPTEFVKVSALRYHRFGELTEQDALRDGFKSYKDMRNTLKKIYPQIDDDDWVTVYDISLTSDHHELYAN
ncbi:MAG TPA: carbamoyltransferase C-terminal domain-containing protein [Streptosporangiaceae bacterium]|nr:carbamoyltransferase C-terminal domain-containing protein [Streptosporangiaceae bacterium]